MGKLVRADVARLMTLSAAAYALWANFWGILYRKFFWDMLGSTLGPAGLVPPPSAQFFINVIVKAPIVQIINMVMAAFILALEWPLPFFQNTSLNRSRGFKIVLLLFNGFTNFLVYQSVDAGFFFGVAASFYGDSLRRGETPNLKPQSDGEA